MILSEIQEGQTVNVRSIDAGFGMNSRLTAMGILPGIEITVKKNSGRGPIVVQVKDSKIALGRGMAHKIEVQ